MKTAILANLGQLTRDKLRAGGVQQCRSTTVPKKTGKFQNNYNAFYKEREITDARNKENHFGAEISTTANYT